MYQILMKRLNSFLAILVCLFCSSSLSGQNKEDLKKQKIEIEKEISYTSSLLKKTKTSKTKSLNYLKVLKSQIKSQEELLITLTIEINLFNKKIKKTHRNILKTESEIIIQEQRLKQLKGEYEKMIYAAFKKKGGRNEIIFVISSSDFNQAYKRVLYLKQYSSFRKNQAFKIEKTRSELINRRQKLAQQKEKLIENTALKTVLLSSKKEELESVNKKKTEKQELLKKLSKSERVFKKELQEKEAKATLLNQKIRKIIEEEIASAKKSESVYKLTPESQAISSEFVESKGNLPWPLAKGIVISSYGKQQHDIFTEVETFNNGLDFATSKGEHVRSIFDGVVSRIFFIKGAGRAVLINHGEYFSVYSGLEEVMVGVGEKVLSKESIGIILTHEEENKTELHFEIWRGYEKQNPSNWLYNAY